MKVKQFARKSRKHFVIQQTVVDVKFQPSHRTNDRIERVGNRD